MLISSLCIALLVETSDVKVGPHSYWSFTNPDIHIEFAAKHQFLGRFEFEIGDVADGSRHHFVDAENGRLKSMWIVQRESIKPTSDVTYNYSFDGASSIEGHRFRCNTFAFSNHAAHAENPNGEAARTAALLRQKGVEFDDEWCTYRMVAVPDPARKHELIVSYVEPATANGVRLADLYVNDEETPKWKSVGKKLERQAMAELGVRH